jgi:ATP adenylyltransferase
MVGKVLTGNTRYGNGAYSLIGGDELSDCVTWPKASMAEPLRDELLQLCRQRLYGFRAQRGEEVFAHRSGWYVLSAGGRRLGAAGKALGLRRRRL